MDRQRKPRPHHSRLKQDLLVLAHRCVIFLRVEIYRQLGLLHVAGHQLVHFGVVYAFVTRARDAQLPAAIFQIAAIVVVEHSLALLCSEWLARNQFVQ